MSEPFNLGFDLPLLCERRRNCDSCGEGTLVSRLHIVVTVTAKIDMATETVHSVTLQDFEDKTCFRFLCEECEAARKVLEYAKAKAAGETQRLWLDRVEQAFNAISQTTKTKL